MIKIKVCGITESLNAYGMVDAGADFLGFIFYPQSKRYVGVKPDHLFKAVPSGVKKAGVFVNQNINLIIQTAKQFHLDFIQVHGGETAESCRKIKDAGLKVIKAFGIDDAFDFTLLKTYLTACDYFLFDTRHTDYGGSGLQFNWETLRRYTLKKPFFLSGGIGPADAERIRLFNHPYLYGVDINSCFETNPGIKDPVAVKRFINKIKNV
jgi:phosphoribosylanthranilate isomerase